MPQEDQQGHLQLQIDCPFYSMTLCLIRWFSIKNMYSFFLTQQDIACWALYSAMFFISQISSFQEITVYEL